MGATAAAADPINGLWQGDVRTVRIETSPSVHRLADGQYSCTSCKPAQNVPADGRFYSVKGHLKYDELSVTVLNPRSIRLVRRKAGKVVGEEASEVSADGQHLAFVYRNFESTADVPSEEAGTKRRVAPQREGEHLISGAWITEQIASVSPELLTSRFRVEGDVLHMSSPTGDGYSARLDGTETPMLALGGVETVSVRRLDVHTYEETVKRNGIVLGVTKMIIAPDGASMIVVWENKTQPGKTTYTAYRK